MARQQRKEGRLPRNAAPIEVEIDHIGGRGDGVGRASYTHNYQIREHAVFVPATLPGERVLVQPLSLSGQGLKGRIIEMLQPSAERQSPNCNAFPACGGCKFQHWGDDAVRQWKEELALGFITRAGLRPEAMRPLVTSPLASRRRAVFHIKRLADSVAAGFQERQGVHIISPEGCSILDPDLLAILDEVRAFAATHFPVGSEIDLHVNKLDRGLCLYFTGPASWSPALMAALAEWASAQADSRPDTSPAIARVTVRDGHSGGGTSAAAGMAAGKAGGKGGRKGGGRWASKGRTPAKNTAPALPMMLYAPTPPILRFGAIGVTPPPGAFLQATAHGEAHLQDAIAEITAGAKYVADLFAGCGTLSLPLLPQLAGLIAAEQDLDALAALKDGADAAGLGAVVSARATDLAQAPLLASELKKCDAVILDPPRSGAAAQCSQLAESKVPVIAMVSCNPASFARDAALLVAGGYRFDWVQLIDQFRMTNHVELVAKFSRP